MGRREKTPKEDGEESGKVKCNGGATCRRAGGPGSPTHQPESSTRADKQQSILREMGGPLQATWRLELGANTVGRRKREPEGARDAPNSVADAPLFSGTRLYGPGNFLGEERKNIGRVPS